MTIFIISVQLILAGYKTKKEPLGLPVSFCIVGKRRDDATLLIDHDILFCQRRQRKLPGFFAGHPPHFGYFSRRLDRFVNH